MACTERCKTRPYHQILTDICLHTWNKSNVLALHSLVAAPMIINTNFQPHYTGWKSIVLGLVRIIIKRNKNVYFPYQYAVCNMIYIKHFQSVTQQPECIAMFAQISLDLSCCRPGHWRAFHRKKSATRSRTSCEQKNSETCHLLIVDLLKIWSWNWL